MIHWMVTDYDNSIRTHHIDSQWCCFWGSWDIEIGISNQSAGILLQTMATGRYPRWCRFYLVFCGRRRCFTMKNIVAWKIVSPPFSRAKILNMAKCCISLACKFCTHVFKSQGITPALRVEQMAPKNDRVACVACSWAPSRLWRLDLSSTSSVEAGWFQIDVSLYIYIYSKTINIEDKGVDTGITYIYNIHICTPIHPC